MFKLRLCFLDFRRSDFAFLPSLFRISSFQTLPLLSSVKISGVQSSLLPFGFQVFRFAFSVFNLDFRRSDFAFAVFISDQAFRLRLFYLQFRFQTFRLRLFCLHFRLDVQTSSVSPLLALQFRRSDFIFRRLRFQTLPSYGLYV